MSGGSHWFDGLGREEKEIGFRGQLVGFGAFEAEAESGLVM